jgi:ZIP family zinc transporter
VLLAVIACAAFISTLSGGLLAWRLQDKLHLILGFSAGAVIGVAFFDLLPEALSFAVAGRGASTTLAWTALGFLAYLVFDRVLSFHGPVTAKRGLLGAGVFCIHSFLDGMAIGLAFQASHAGGLIVAIAVLTHDFSDGVNTMNVVMKNGGTRRQALPWLLADALAPTAGILATLAFTMPTGTVGLVLAVFAGFFFYIGASDLIPESYHAHPKFLTTAMTLAGAAVLYLAVCMAAHAASTTVAGVEVADTAQVGGTTLVLNGAGKRTKWIFDVYVGGLYLTAHQSDADKILADPNPKRISMILMRNLSAEQLSDALREGMSLNSTPEELVRMGKQLEALTAIITSYGSANKGDILTIDFLADGTTQFGRNLLAKSAPIPGRDFQRALLAIWLGPKPIQPDLKKALLGT